VETTLRRDALLSEARTLLSKENFSREDSSRAEQLMNLADRCGPQAMQLRRAKVASDLLDLGIRSTDNAADPTVELEFRQFLAHGQISLLSEKTRLEMSGAVAQSRSEGEGSGVAGGYTVPASFMAELWTSLKQNDQLFGVETVIKTKTGSALTPTIVDDTSISASIIPESGLSNEVDVSLPAGASFGICPTWRTGSVLASFELVNDSAFNLSDALARVFGARFARGVGAAFTQILLNGATSAFISASPSALAADEVVDLFTSVDPAYSINGAWLMNPRTFGAISKIQSDTAGGLYKFPVQVDAQGRPLLLGKVVYLSPSMPNLASGQTAVAFGDLSRFVRREVESSLVVKMYREKYATWGQYGWEAFWRLDGLLMIPPPSGSPLSVISPVRVITQHS
jgi:HK97 family phage major capsid protein